MSTPFRKQNDYGVKRSDRNAPGGGGGVARPAAAEDRPAPPRFEEQQPMMRFAAISPPAQQQRTIHYEPALRRVEPGGLAHLRPLRGVGQPELIKSSPAKDAAIPLRERSKSDSSLLRKWQIDDASLTERPTDFPPLKTTRTVLDAKAHEITDRLSKCLQSRSIKVRFSKKEVNVARCRNIDCCKFTIRLYSGEEGGVMVEIHRLCGDCISFMRDCRALLDAAEGKEADGAPKPEEKPMYLRLPVSQMSFLKTASVPPTSPEDDADCVNTTADLLSSHRSDSNVLGMESLVVQTDPLKTIQSTAVLASRRVLCPNEPGNEKFSIHNYVMSLLIHTSEPENVSDDNPEEEQNQAVIAREEHSARLRNLAASSVHNALSLLSKEGLLGHAIAAEREWYASVLVPVLVRDLEFAADRPHDACYASRCLAVLAETSIEFASKMKDAGGHDALEKAKGVGTREFAMLARDAGSCYKTLSCCV